MWTLDGGWFWSSQLLTSHRPFQADAPAPQRQPWATEHRPARSTLAPTDTVEGRGEERSGGRRGGEKRVRGEGERREERKEGNFINQWKGNYFHALFVGFISK